MFGISNTRRLTAPSREWPARRHNVHAARWPRQITALMKPPAVAHGIRRYRAGIPQFPRNSREQLFEQHAAARRQTMCGARLWNAAARHARRHRIVAVDNRHAPVVVGQHPPGEHPRHTAANHDRMLSTRHFQTLSTPLFEGTRAQRTRYVRRGGVLLYCFAPPSRPVRFSRTRAQRTRYGPPRRRAPLMFRAAPSRPVRFSESAKSRLIRCEK